MTCTPELAKQKLRQFQPQAPIEIMPGVGHWVQFEAANAFNALLRAMLASLARG